MKKCHFSKVQGGIACDACGRFVRGNLPTTTVAVCGMHHKNNLVAVGDVVAGVLSAVGITKERVSAAAGGKCNCSSRQEKLNQIGFLVQYKAIKAVDAAYRFVAGE